jgi:hypothetical protein
MSIRKVPFYTENYSHPHPLVRMINIFSYFCDCVKDDFPKLKIEMQEVFNNVLAINKVYFDSLIKNSDAIEGFLDDLIAFSEEIHAYNNKLYDVAINDESIKNLLKISGINVNTK